MPFKLDVIGAAVFVGALPVGGEFGLEEGAEVSLEGRFVGCELEFHKKIGHSTVIPNLCSPLSGVVVRGLPFIWLVPLCNRPLDLPLLQQRRYVRALPV